MLSYLIWVPIVIIYYAFFSWFTKQNNELGGNWTFVLYLYGMFWPGWVVVSKFSKNLLFDGMLYDNIMFLTYVVTMISLGAHAKLAMHQWIGVALIVTGSVCMRVDFLNT